MLSRFLDIAALDEESGLANVVIDTPRGSRNKYKIDEKLGMLKLSRIPRTAMRST
jgi:inorganic pyrophosphatase